MSRARTLPDLPAAVAGDLPWHARDAAEAAAALAADLDRGLAAAEAARRLAQSGRNEPAPRRREAWWRDTLEALTEPLVLLLVTVAALYALLGQIEDALTIAAVILAVAGIEVANETRARRAITSLRTLSAPTATVVRDGEPADVPAAEVVPGDLVLLAPGDRVPADLRLVESVALRLDESSLTGESAPAVKQADLVLPAEAEPADRRNLAFAGTLVTAGKGRGIVVATGPRTALGRTARLAEEVREPRTPLQQQLGQLAGWLLWLALGFSALIPALGVLLGGQPLREMLLTGLTLAFATIPEELPILVTIVLGLGAYRLARQRAVIKRLAAAEALGSVSAIGTDKTGTLTENRMRVAELLVDGAARPAAGGPITAGAVRVPPSPGCSEAAADGSEPSAMAAGGRPPEATAGGSSPGAAASDRAEALTQLLAIAVLANDAQPISDDGPMRYAGDPMEVALLEAAAAAGVDVGRLRAAARVVEEYPFDDARKRMSVIYERDGERWLAVKGAPETVLPLCERVRAAERPEALDPARRQQLQQAAETMAARGLRVLAFAERRLVPPEDSRPAGERPEPGDDGVAPDTTAAHIGTRTPPGPAQSPPAAPPALEGQHLAPGTPAGRDPGPDPEASVDPEGHAAPGARHGPGGCPGAGAGRATPADPCADPCGERPVTSGVPPDLPPDETGLTFVGLVGLDDPVRPEAPAAVAALHAAGVRVLMLTGDHPATARAVAEQVGIDASRIVPGRELELAGDGALATLVGEAAVFARITPEQKLRVVRALAARGEIVAVTGDGVNDAPALREAAIGVAMGRTGTDVAREAADLVLADDNLATVVAAVGAGRRLYANLRKAVRYYLAAKVALVTTSAAAALAQLPIPFAPIQIIVLELFMDLGASTTFVAEPDEGDVMTRRPRDPKQPLLDRSMRLAIASGGLSLAAAVLVAYGWALAHGLTPEAARTTAFAAWMAGHLALAAHMRTERQPLLQTGLGSNRPFLLWAAAAAALLGLGTALPSLAARLALVPLPPLAWAVALATGLLAPSWWEVVKARRWRVAAQSRGAGRCS